MTNDLKSLQVRMANLYMHQKERGGIIDLNVEDANVISIRSEEANERVSFRPERGIFNAYDSVLITHKFHFFASFSF